MRAMNRCEQFVANRAHALSEANPDPFMYDAAIADFMRELAVTVAQALGESAPPAQLLAWSNYFYTKLAEVRAGVPQGVRIMPFGTLPAPLPTPDEVPDAVAQLLPPPPPAPSVMLTHWQIRDARDRLKLAQLAVARLVGVSQNTISVWEHRQDDPAKRPTAEDCVRLRRALNLPEFGDPFGDPA